MTKEITLKLNKDVLDEADVMTRKAKMSRKKYISDALAFYNQYTKRRLLRDQLHRESRRVRKTSAEVLSELEKLDDDFLNED